MRIHDDQLTFNVFNLSQEADHDNKELMEEPNKEAQAPHIRTPMVNNQCDQKEQQPSVIQKEPDPPKSHELDNKTILKKETTRNKLASSDTRKKVPRGWKNKKIPTEDFSPVDEVVSTYFPFIPPHLPTIPSQLPLV